MKLWLFLHFEVLLQYLLQVHVINSKVNDRKSIPMMKYCLPINFIRSSKTIVVFYLNNGGNFNGVVKQSHDVCKQSGW